MQKNNKMFNKYIKYKTKYFNLIGGAQFRVINKHNNPIITAFLEGLGFFKDKTKDNEFSKKYNGNSNFIELVYDSLNILPDINIIFGGE